MKKYKHLIVSFLLVLLFLIITAVTWVYSQVDSALPILDGKVTLYGLNSQAVIERDVQGIPTIKAETRADVAVATGFIHAQERFFQMDLLRRNSAGELASLFGTLALDYDKKIRRHRFRERARKIVSALPKDQMEILQAYTRGVNQGLDLLKTAPFEYLLLQQEPVEWQEEDSILCVLSMYIDLQSHDGRRERSLGLMQAVLGDDVFQFLNPKGSQWDAAIDGTTFMPAPMPNRPWPAASNAAITNSELPKQIEFDYNSEQFPGSNNWAVSGAVSKTKSAIVANDMHLGIRVPNTWFRASIEYTSSDANPDNKNGNSEKIKVTGVTLPGTPNVIAGSNSHIAWGFTNSYGDWSDIVILETNEDKTQYLTPEGYEPFTEHKQIIAVKGEDAVKSYIKETRWGPVIGENHLGQLLAYRWVAHDINAVNLTQIELETSKNVTQAFEVAGRTGIPAQNLMVGDSSGNIGWTIMGPIPIKQGDIGDTPKSWANGDNAWTGYLQGNDYPKVKNPENERLWTANSRVVGGGMLDIIGNGGYALGARSSQIRDRLLAKEDFAEQDLLDIALDDEAMFLKPWQQFLLDNVLTPEAVKQKPEWQQARSFVEAKPLRASIDSVGYRIVRNFRIALRNSVFSELNASLSKLDEGFNAHALRHQIEIPLWQMVTQQTDQFLMLPEQDWTKLLAKTLDKTLNDMTKDQPLVQATWGQQNTSAIRHPLSAAVPIIGKWLDMPATPLAGDSYIPRVQGTNFGASERMVVSPGHEETGIFHMPTSQSGHPWSPYYGMGHSDWEQGNASPFLPGETKYSLSLLSY